MPVWSVTVYTLQTAYLYNELLERANAGIEYCRLSRRILERMTTGLRAIALWGWTCFALPPCGTGHWRPTTAYPGKSPGLCRNRCDAPGRAAAAFRHPRR